MRSATVRTTRPCRRANSTRSGTRAMVPSSFMISQITAAGVRPARRARSTDASVWPARFSTPPRRARSGKTWPGRSRSSGRVAGSTAVRTVAARSAAEMPVVTLPRASIETVKAVPNGEVLRAHHQRQVELVAALLGQRQADQAAAVAGHEVDRLGGHLLGRDRQVALVLAVLVVDHDHHPALAELRQRLLDGGERVAGRAPSDREVYAARGRRVSESGPPPRYRVGRRRVTPALRSRRLRARPACGPITNGDWLGSPRGRPRRTPVTTVPYRRPPRQNGLPRLMNQTYGSSNGWRSSFQPISTRSGPTGER